MTESALHRILQPGGITPVYQPIVRATAEQVVETYGLECLSRGPAGTNFESADVLFEYVRLKREESLVDRACISVALHGAHALGDLPLGINVHASTLGRDHGFLAFLRKTADAAHINVARLTIEIVEHAPPWDGMSFLTALDELRAIGANIAVDDVGLGQSNFKMLLDVRPDYLKLDRYFVQGCSVDPRRRAVIAAICQLAADSDAELIAEGVEVPEDAATLQSLGVTLMQGFLYAAPMTLDVAREYLAA